MYVVGQPGNPLRRAGDAIGIEFNNNRNVIPTLNCHALFEWYYSVSEVDNDEKLRVANKLMESVMHRVFTLGVNVNKLPSSIDDSENHMLQAAYEAGISKELMKRFVDCIGSETYEDILSDVQKKDFYAKSALKVNGVPYVIIENQNNMKRPIVFSGGQPVEMMIDCLEEAYKA